MSTKVHISNETTLLRIGDLAKATGVTVRTLRYYEEMGLIGPVRRSDSQYRLYVERSVKRVRAIVAMQDLGYSLDAILLMLGPYTTAPLATKAAQINRTRESLSQLKTQLNEKLAMLQDLQRDVEARLALLETVCGPCAGNETQYPCDDACTHREAHLD